MNPIEEFLKEKVAAPSMGDITRNVGEHLARPLLYGATTAAGTALIAGTAIAAQRIYDAATSKRDFRKMMEWNQDLKDEDQRLVTQSFRTLRRFAPEMSKDPLVAGSFLRRMVESPTGSAGIVQEAMRGQGLVTSPVRDAMLGAVGKGVTTGLGPEDEPRQPPFIKPHFPPGRS